MLSSEKIFMARMQNGYLWENLCDSMLMKSVLLYSDTADQQGCNLCTEWLQAIHGERYIIE